MKLLLYIISALQFYFYRLFFRRINNHHVFIMTHDSSCYGNVEMMRKMIVENNGPISSYILKKQVANKSKLSKIKVYLELLFIAPKQLARAKYIYLDNVYLPMAFMRFNKDVKIIQLWHGLNTVKKFGQLSNQGLLKKLEKSANSTYTHVIVSSHDVIELHERAFGVCNKKIYPLGLPRVDLLQDEKLRKQIKNKILNRYPEIKHKKVILYAPTFRDNELESQNEAMNLSSLHKNIGQDSFIITKLHPHVKVDVTDSLGNKIAKEYSIFELMCVADLLITDYSSIIFEFALMRKPVLIYAYDLDEYDQEIRGFYKTYNQILGDSINYSKEALIESINTVNWSDFRYSEFVETYIKTVIKDGCRNIHKLIYTDFYR